MDWATLGLACLLGVLEFRPEVNDTEVVGVMMVVGFGEKSILCFPPKTNKPERVRSCIQEAGRVGWSDGGWRFLLTDGHHIDG